MELRDNASAKSGTKNDSSANIAASADHLLTNTERLRRLADIARDKLTYEEATALIQEDRDAVAPLVYSQGLRDGEERLLARQREERERRKVARGKKVWVTAVYFIRSPNAVKIGISKNPARRLAVLQTGHPDILELAATCEGGRELEREYHDRFAEYRQGKSEWFTLAPEILTEIERLAQTLSPQAPA